ncbi:acetyl-CoA carboxylase biotin carboxylase subunit [Lactiplantibacillus modestisalitolerans]|uniref:biotin carboxylase n=1 Tax=Lactiplantibacillus modestisalitolerans TaxID=1457219 RepID=A0ABV5WXW1_9LACO|nr:acetyl-CoA carboxylase biotin carboxylase subunit [Lactiplantibacillus modestisalitolerans]
MKTKRFTKVLVANRGEIAVQIIRALHELNIQAVAVYTPADQDSPAVRLADEAVCIGPNPVTASYLNMQAIISAANLTGCQAIHPGYGFLSENATFAELCAACHLTFIGPSAALITKMGDKEAARETMHRLGVPVIPGSHQVITNLAEAETVAKQLGYPVMLKAAAGGGGKGIRTVTTAQAMSANFQSAQREARASYSDDRLYVEKILTNVKHVEVQVLADHFGHVVALPERDCSLQRHHQKIIEESPCALVTPKQRQWLLNLVATTTKRLGYTNTGTFEFLMDQQGRFYFLEMNTRLQVEHPVTEMVTGLELIKLQVRIAAGQPLPLRQADVQLTGVAMECRFNAEDPQHDFRPQPGTIKKLVLPTGSLGVRIDAGIVQGSLISPFYDSMIAKIVVHGPDRQRVCQKMQRCLAELQLSGLQTNRRFLHDLVGSPLVQTAKYTTEGIETQFMKGWLDAQTKISTTDDRGATSAAS